MQGGGAPFFMAVTNLGYKPTNCTKVGKVLHLPRKLIRFTIEKVPSISNLNLFKIGNCGEAINSEPQLNLPQQLNIIKKSVIYKFFVDHLI